MPVAIVHERFLAQVTALQEASADMAAVNGPGTWMLLDQGGWSGNPLDIPGMTEAFDRDDINQQYAEMLADPNDSGSLGSCIALKLQADWLAMLERGFRTRHSTSIRSAIHAAARRGGHAQDKGIFKGGVLKYVQDVIVRGGG